MKNELRDITLDTPTVSSGEQTLIQHMLLSFWLVCGDRSITTSLCNSLSVSLAIHPDKIRIATGQIAGVDKDGRVRTFVCLFVCFT